jgi:hypothetical protein
MRQSSELCGSPTARFSMWNCDDVLESAIGGGDGRWFCTYRHVSGDDVRETRRLLGVSKEIRVETLNRTVSVFLSALSLLADDSGPYESNVFWYDGGVGGFLIGQWAGHSRRFSGGAGSSLNHHRRSSHALAYAKLTFKRVIRSYMLKLLAMHCTVLD